MDLQVFTTMLVLVSGLTTLTVEAIKNATETKKPALVAVIVSVVLGLCVCASYPILFGSAYTVQYCVLSCWIILLSAVCSQVGYDKVKLLIEEVFK